MRWSETSGAVVGLLIVGVVAAMGAVPREPSNSPRSASVATSDAEPRPVYWVKGTIIRLDLRDEPPSLLLSMKGGHNLPLGLNRKTSWIWKDHKLMRLDALAMDQHVKVRYVERAGKKWVESLDIIEPEPSQPDSSSTAPSPSLP